MRINKLWACAMTAVLAACSADTGKPIAVIDPATDASGVMHVPTGYRESYQALGTWAVAADKGQGAKQLHIVYASPGSVAARQKTGTFPDGAVLVKEVFDATTAPMTTGTVSHASKLVGWFIMTRDSKNSHPGNKLWGEGWGWAWFDADRPTKTTSTDYKTDCVACHEPARKSGMIYEEGYPSLN